MEMLAHVGIEGIIIEAFCYLHKNMEFGDFEVMCQKAFKSKDSTVRDCVGLAIARIDNPLYIPIIKSAIENESIAELAEDLSKVLIQLEETNYTNQFSN